MNPSKSGFQTSEFYVVLATIAGIFVNLNLITSMDADVLVKFFDALVAFVSACWVAYIYVKSRTDLKKAAMDQDSVTVVADETPVKIETTTTTTTTESVPSEGSV